MRLLYYCIVEDPLIYRVKGCVGETHFPQQTPPKRHPSHTIDHGPKVSMQKYFVRKCSLLKFWPKVNRPA
jgi:hypothetical protein